MTTALTPMQTFEEKVKARLKETIADMLPDEALQGLVERALEEQFFKSTVIRNSWGEQVKIEPSWFSREVVNLAKPIIEEYAKKEFERRREDVDKAISDFIARDGLMLLFNATALKQTQQQMFNEMVTFAQNIKNGIRM